MSAVKALTASKKKLIEVRVTHRQFSPSVDGLPRGHVFVFCVIAKNAIFFPSEGL